MPENYDLQAALNRLAGTSGLDAQGAANVALAYGRYIGGQTSGTKSGSFMALGIGQTTSASLSNGVLRLAPVFFPMPVTLSEIGFETTNATTADAGSKFRPVIYSDTGGLYPNALVLDVGQQDATTQAVVAVTISQSLAAGTYWIGGVLQANVTTQPTFRAIASPNFAGIVNGSTNAVVSATAFTAVTQSAVTGAPPATFTSTVTGSGTMPRLYWKIA